MDSVPDGKKYNNLKNESLVFTLALFTVNLFQLR